LENIRIHLASGCETSFNNVKYIEDFRNDTGPAGFVRHHYSEYLHPALGVDQGDETT
jgi:hypothetical protein